jgi:hypothetical protein
MRDDEDNIRQYLPVLRRIIILVAVLTAIPMVMWTITAFVRSHIGPARAPALQPMAIAPADPSTSTTVAAEQPPASSARPAQAAPVNASAYTGGTDAASAAPVDATPTATTTAFKTASVAAPSTTAPDDAKPSAMPPAPSASASDAAASPADSGAPDQSSDNNSTQVAARSQESAWPAPPTAAAAALPPGEPISGQVPLPRKRPTSFAMAGNVPLPAPRPQAAGGGGADSSPTAIDWLKKVFHSPPDQSSDGGSDTAHE